MYFRTENKILLKIEILVATKRILKLLLSYKINKVIIKFFTYLIFLN